MINDNFDRVKKSRLAKWVILVSCFVCSYLMPVLILYPPQYVRSRPNPDNTSANYSTSGTLVSRMFNFDGYASMSRSVAGLVTSEHYWQELHENVGAKRHHT